MFYSHRHHHHCVPADLHLAARGRPSVQAHGLDGDFRAARLAACSRCSSRRCSRASCFGKNVREWHNPVMIWITHEYRRPSGAAIQFRWITVGVALRPCSACRRYLTVSGVIGSEFLPHLDEGAIWARGTLAPSTGPTEGHASDESGARDSRVISRGHQVIQPDRPARMTEPIPPASSTPNISWISSPRSSGVRFFARTRKN